MLHLLREILKALWAVRPWHEHAWMVKDDGKHDYCTICFDERPTKY